MRHGIAHRKLGRNPGHRKSLLRNMMNALVRSEKIQTTVSKAKEIRRLADRLITLGKRDTTHSRRRAFAILSDKENTDKIFSTLAARFAGREGGYTRIVRTGYRVGDGSELAILEYLPAEEKKGKPKKGRKKAAPTKGKKPTETTKREKPSKAEKKPAAKKAPASRAKKEKKEEEPKKPAKKRKTKEKPESE